jgi:hypothetical protein
LSGYERNRERRTVNLKGTLFALCFPFRQLAAIQILVPLYRRDDLARHWPAGRPGLGLWQKVPNSSGEAFCVGQFRAGEGGNGSVEFVPAESFVQTPRKNYRLQVRWRNTWRPASERIKVVLNFF